MTTPENFLMGGAPSAAFPTIGTTHIGVITTEPTISQERDPVDGKLKFWDDGNPRNQLVVTIQTEERDPTIQDDDGMRRLFIKSNSRRAVSDAVRKAGAKGLSVGGTLGMTYTGDGPQENKALHAPKLYTATYTAPTGQAVDAFLNGTPPAAAPAPAQAGAAPAAFTAEQLAAMKAAGMDTSRFTSV